MTDEKIIKRFNELAQMDDIQTLRPAMERVSRETDIPFEIVRDAIVRHWNGNG